MSKNPIINAFSATAYIIVIVSILNYVSQTQGHKPDSAFAPIVFLSLLTLSVSVMAYIFFYQPLVLIIDGKKKEAIRLFVKTVGIFGAITAIISIIIFSGIFSK